MNAINNGDEFQNNNIVRKQANGPKDGRAKGKQTSVVRDDNCLRGLTPTENRASREAQRWQPHHSTTQPQTGTVLRNY
jgi:hypothetical protein